MIRNRGWHDSEKVGACMGCSANSNHLLKEPPSSGYEYSIKPHQVLVFRVLNNEIRLCADALKRFNQEYQDTIYLEVPA